MAEILLQVHGKVLQGAVKAEDTEFAGDSGTQVIEIAGDRGPVSIRDIIRRVKNGDGLGVASVTWKNKTSRDASRGPRPVTGILLREDATGELPDDLPERFYVAYVWDNPDTPDTINLSGPTRKRAKQALDIEDGKIMLRPVPSS